LLRSRRTCALWTCRMQSSSTKGRKAPRKLSSCWARGRGEKMRRSNTLVLLILAGALAACSRPTQQESTYRLNLQNKFSWQGQGPDIRLYWPWYTMSLISHQQQIQNFPLIQKESSANLSQIELEKLQSIITADGQIMIQEMSITVYQKADPTAVERFYVQHQEEDRENLATNLDGLVRTYLQTKTKAYIESHQPQLGQEVRD